MHEEIIIPGVDGQGDSGLLCIGYSTEPLSE
jgi:hypothetical protein